ncbi:MAG: type II toxin-antitoxin system RelE/ParE family toxin [Ignavibacteriales bacterium]|nr:type II toxin-antitoxin system RelE/ParE family toxin [Ignavibacteriales bacterium]
MANLSFNPRPFGVQKLFGENGYRIRVGRYRVLFEVHDGQRKVFIYRIKHRKDVYR